MTTTAATDELPEVSDEITRRAALLFVETVEVRRRVRAIVRSWQDMDRALAALGRDDSGAEGLRLSQETGSELVHDLLGDVASQITDGLDGTTCPLAFDVARDPRSAWPEDAWPLGDVPAGDTFDLRLQIVELEEEADRYRAVIDRYRTVMQIVAAGVDLAREPDYTEPPGVFRLSDAGGG